MKRILAIVISVALVLSLAACGSTSIPKTTTAPTATVKPNAVPTATPKPATSSSSSSFSSSASSSSSRTFTNAYGTPTTRCAHPGCNNYIASSGDTNCCTTHSHKCLECGKYIDEDATWCMSCIAKALG